MTRSLARLACITILCITFASCSGAFRQHSPATQQELDWNTLMVQVDSAVRTSRYDIADRLLADFAARNPARQQTAEVPYWRALYKLDPANMANNAHEVIALLDSYLESPVASQHRTDAVVLRRVAAVLEARAAVAAAPVPTTSPTAPTIREDRAKDEELAKLKDELAKANAELERIKKRLAAPAPD